MKSKRITAFVSAIAVASSMIVPVTVSHAEATTLTVGTDKQYQTIREAVAAATAINPQSEADRVTINVDPGFYEEQAIFDNVDYVTFQKTPEAEGEVTVSWYYCTGYCAGDADLNGNYDPLLNWSLEETWTGYNEGDEQFTKYELGQKLDGVSTISYYDTEGVAHKDVPVKTTHLGSGTGLAQMAPLIVRGGSTNITVKDITFINSVPAMVTEGEKRVGVAPEADRQIGVATSYELPRREALAVCDYDTVEEVPDEILTNGAIDKAKFKTVSDAHIANGTTFTAGESAWLAKSSLCNERGHAISVYNGDKITFENVRAIGNQDSVYVGEKRIYFKNCDLIGGTDYIYAGATVVFDSCLLGAYGMSDKDYGATITAANTKSTTPYGYLFYNCTLYNVRDNITGSMYGRPWGADAQITFYNTKIDDNASIGKSPASITNPGWRDMSGGKKEEARFYEYGTTNLSDGSAVDLSGRVVNTKQDMGTVLDQWQILEFNPRNYLASNGIFDGDWDPMNFGETYLAEVDAAMAAATIEIPSNEEVTFNLPTAPDGLAYKWESASTNAVVSEDGTKVTVIRPAAGESNIETTVTLYAMDTETGLGDKKEIPVVITPTTNTTDVFNIPVTVTTSAALDEANNFNITISKNGAVIKRDTVTMAAGETSVTKTIENVPANAEGIEYDVKVVSESNEISIASPEDGSTTITGVTGQNVNLDIIGQIQVDMTVNTGVAYSSSEGNKTFDLIALAMANGATSDIAKSDVIKVTYTLDVTPTTSGNSFIDILAGTPTSSVNQNGAQVPSRFLLGKLGHWNQLDHIDSGAEKFSGSSNTPNQWLNACGEFTAGTSSTVEITIDYKNKILSASGSGSGAKSSYTFAQFPEAERGKLNMAVYAGGETFSISSVSVTYKDIVGEVDPETAFNMPITVATNAKLEADTQYLVKVSNNGADIASKTITVPAGENYATDVIENLEGSETGVTYDVTVQSLSGDMTVTTPENGVTTITGIAKQDAYLYVVAKKTEDKTIKLDKTYDSSTGVAEVIDLINLAGSEAATSPVITVKYTLNTPQKPTNTYNYMALTTSSASNVSTGTDANRFALWRIYSGWDQLDMADCSTSFAGVSDTENQWLNIAGKFDYAGTASVVSTTVDYNAKTVSATASGSGSYQGKTSFTFGAFPENVERGNLYLTVAPAGVDTFTVTDLEVTYKALAEGGEAIPTMAPTPEPTPTPVPTETPVETTAPTTAPVETTQPTEKPVEGPAIVNVTLENGNTVVTLANIGEGVVIAVDRGNDELKAIKTADVPATDAVEKTVTIEGIEADEVYVWDSLEGMKPLCKSYEVKPTPAETEKPVETTAPVETVAPITEPVTVDFTTMSAVPVYSEESGQGFVEKSSAIMPSGYERKVASADKITISSEGAKITETDGSYLYKKSNSNDGDDFNNGGLIYRIDTGKAGAYRLEVEVTGTSDNTVVAPNGMDGRGLTKTSNWDNAGEVPRTVSASWNASVWTYDFATGADFVEIEIEPKTLATASAPQTVGVKSIKVTPLDVNAAGDKPTIHIIGDSTQKTYTFNETISAWGQTLVNYFDASKANVVNYSMGGRAMKSNYNEGRFGEILISGKEGDFVFIHSAHNDETISTNRFSRGAGSVKDDLAANNENYNKWLDMYVEAIKARGMTPVLVSAMPRIGSNKYSENALKPNGFNPDSPANMRAKAAEDSEVGFVELYAGAKAYMDLIDAKEVTYIYNNTEAGETPANNSANGANGDGTHYKEAAAKQWNRIMLQSIYDQSVAETDTYTDKGIMTELVALMPESVVNAAKTGDWSAVFPEMASDVSAVGVVPGATKQSESAYYYRNNIEKALQLGLIKKDAQNMFKPNEIITVGDFARGAEKAFGLEENSLTSYTKTYAELESAVSTSSVEEAEVIKTASVDTDVVEVAEAGEGQWTVTITQPEGGTVTVYNESAFKTATIDVPAGVTASSVIGDNDFFTLTAPAELVAKSDKSGVFSDNSEVSTNYIEFRNANPEKKVVYTAKADGVITVYARFNDNKTIELVDQSGTLATQSIYLNDQTAAGSGSTIYGIVHFNVKSGTTYDLYARGGTGRLFGVKYESTDYPQSTTSLVVNDGDEVKVVAVANENYVNKAILVNGETKATSKEYTFTVTDNTTVTAEFTAEPALVETTVVASDAALTREIMGAILYDAYLAAYGKNADGDWNKVSYMNQNGGVPSPDDPNYDPNIKYEGSPYIPLTGWGALEDLDGLSEDLYAKVKQAYNLGLIRSEQGIARGSIACGNELEPKAVVTRAKAAKSLVFAFILTQPLNDASQKLPNGNLAADTVAEIAEPNADAPSTVIK